MELITFITFNVFMAALFNYASKRKDLSFLLYGLSSFFSFFITISLIFSGGLTYGWETSSTALPFLINGILYLFYLILTIGLIVYSTTEYAENEFNGGYK
jgi:hypothetical protein